MMQPEWKSRIANIVNICQGEIKKTTEIGRKMLSASKTNSCLHESYENLGLLVLRAIREKRLEWDDQRVNELIETIEKCEKNLEDIEREVKKIKFSSAPEDVSKKTKKE